MDLFRVTSELKKIINALFTNHSERFPFYKSSFVTRNDGCMEASQKIGRDMSGLPFEVDGVPWLAGQVLFESRWVERVARFLTRRLPRRRRKSSMRYSGKKQSKSLTLSVA